MNTMPYNSIELYASRFSIVSYECNQKFGVVGYPHLGSDRGLFSWNRSCFLFEGGCWSANGDECRS